MWPRAALFAVLAAAACAGPQGNPSSIKSDIIKTCESNNVTSDKMEQAKIAIEEYLVCLPAMDILSTEFGEVRENGTVDEDARRFCAKAEVTKSCLAKLYKSLGLCGKIDLETDVPYLTNTINRYIDYLCIEDDHKMKLTKFIDDGVTQCMNKRNLEIRECYRAIAHAGNPIKNVKATLENFMRCMVEQMKVCSKAIGDRAQNLVDYIRQ